MEKRQKNNPKSRKKDGPKWYTNQEKSQNISSHFKLQFIVQDIQILMVKLLPWILQLAVQYKIKKLQMFEYLSQKKNQHHSNAGCSHIG